MPSMIIQIIRSHTLCLTVFLFVMGKKERTDREWNRYRNGKFIWSDMVKRDVDACILQAASFDSFLSQMENKGYEIKNAHGEGKYLAVKFPGMKRMIRLKTLGEEYGEECIRQRIQKEPR